jgi:hypothetical protein
VLLTTQMLDYVGAPDHACPFFLWAELLSGSELSSDYFTCR